MTTRKLTYILLFVTTYLSGQAVLAQDADAEVNEEIVVTAQRRDEQLKDVPASISAFGELAIKENQIESLQDFVALSPNIGFSSGGSPIETDLTFRGVSNLGGAVNSVAVIVDDINVTPAQNSTTYDPNLFDVKRIEVLRGPQGTLFGRNVLGGGINIVTNKPGRDFSADIEAEYGRYNARKLRGVINIPLGDAIAVRALGFYNSDDGFIKDVGTGRNTNDVESYGGRIAVRLTPTENLTIDLAAGKSKYKQGMITAIPTGIPRPLFAVFGFPLDPFGDYTTPGGLGFYPQNRTRVATDAPIGFHNDITLFNGSIDLDLGAASFILTGGYIDNEVLDSGDKDYTTGRFFVDPADQSSLKSTSLEARVQSNGDSPLSWVLGAQYSKDKRSNLDNRFILEDFLTAFGLDPAFAPVPVVDELTRIEIESLGVFGELTYRSLNGKLTLSAGIRFSGDRVSESIDVGPVLDFGTGGFTTPRSVGGSTNFENFTPKFSIVYALSDYTNIYARAARGTKPGGFNLQLFGNPNPQLAAFQTYGTESLWNYEVGLKGSAFDNRLSYSLSAFYADWEDLQISSGFFQGSITNFTALTANAGKAKSYGVELDFTARLSDAFKLQGGLGYNNAKLGNDIFGVDDAGSLVDISKNRLPFASRLTANIAGQYTMALSDGLDAFLRAEFNYRSGFFEDVANTGGTGGFVKAYETINLRAGVESDAWRISIFGENLFNDKRTIGVRDPADIGLSGYLATIEPTRFGIRASYSFK